MPIQRRLSGQAIDLLALHDNEPARYPVLLESVTHGQGQGRFDILFAQPQDTLSYHHQTAGSLPDFLAAIDQRWQTTRNSLKTRRNETDLPYDGGWFVFLGYELAAAIEPTLKLPVDESGFPTAVAMRCPAAIIVDHQCRENWLVIADDFSESLNPWLHELQRDLQQIEAGASRGAVITEQSDNTRQSPEEEDSRHFLDSLDRIKQYILDGDVFQVNLARRWRQSSTVDPVALYRRLRSRNPAPFAGLFRWQDMSLLSSSPERLVQVKNGAVSTRPIAGTHPRSRSGDDSDVTESLRQHPKERAEHIMLIDLERNDLGRVCQPGSVEVDELMVIESYAHVHHIVSNVQGQLRSEVTPGEVIRAVFPGGTITGCPKVRCMEIIAELEKRGRGAYTGSMGYLNLNGDMDLNILIRSIQMNPEQATLMAGCGVVADSDPFRELEETRSKARGMLLALSGEEHAYPQTLPMNAEVDDIAHG